MRKNNSEKGNYKLSSLLFSVAAQRLSLTTSPLQFLKVKGEKKAKYGSV